MGTVRSSRLRSGFLFLGLFMLSAALNLAAFRAIRGNIRDLNHVDLDEKEYWSLATALLGGRVDTNLGLRTLGFPVFLAAVRILVGDSYPRAQILTTLVFSLTSPLFYRFVRRELGSERAGLLAGFVAAVWPLFVRYGITLYSETVGLPLFVAYLLITPPREPAHRVRPLPRSRWFAAGVALALCMHVRPAFLFYAPLAAARAVFNGSGLRRGIHAGLLLTLGCTLAVLPWSVFISRQEGQPILLCRNDGRTLAGGLTPRLFELEGRTITTPEGRTTRIFPGKWLDMYETGYIEPEEFRLPTSTVSRLAMQRAINWGLANPAAALYLTVRKLTYMWGIYPIWNGLEETLCGNLPLIVLLTAATAALLRLRRFLPELASLWTLPLFVSLVAVVTWGSWRFRMPGDLGVIGLAVALLFVPEVTAHFAGLRNGFPDGSSDEHRN
jgi:hypothetical protein